MSRKWAVVGATLASFAFLTVGLAAAFDDESPLQKLMAEVNTKTGAVRKATRTAVAYKKGAKEVVKTADELVDLIKKAKDFKEPAEKQKKTQEEWAKLCDEFIKTAEDLSKVAGKADSTQAQAKDAFNKMNKACTDCHTVFRVEEEGEFK